MEIKEPEEKQKKSNKLSCIDKENGYKACSIFLNENNDVENLNF